MKCAMIPSGSGYKVVTPYDKNFVTELKRMIPATDRYYSAKTNCWYVTAQYAGDTCMLIWSCFNTNINLQPITVTPTLGIIEVLYLGATKDRGDGDHSASGWSNDSWSVIFPEKVLKAYFDPNYVEQKTTEKPSTATYYETLSVKPTANADEIKSGYRRMVKQWHPDVCHDPDATEIFRNVQRAYEILSNPKTKARYDIGLKFAKETEKPKARKTNEFWSPYRAPLKCGNLLCEYLMFGWKKKVNKILQWEDIYNAQGQTLVSSWKMGDDAPTLEWK